MKCGDNEQCSNFKCPNGKYKTREEQIRTSTKNRDDRFHVHFCRNRQNGKIRREFGD